MNKIKYLFATLCILVLSVGCDSDSETIIPSSITDVETFPLPGEIGIKWAKSDPSNIEYVKVTYYDMLEKKDMMRLASSYADTIIIPDTRAKYGHYEFTLQPFSSTDTGGEIVTIKGVSDKAPRTIKISGVEKIALSADRLYTDSQEPSEGPIKNLLDGNLNTYFHAAWSVNNGPMPHYIVVDLGEMYEAMKFGYTTRNHAGAGNHPKHMDVYVSKTFDGSTYDVSGLTKMASLSDLPNGASQKFNSGDYILDDVYRYVWFEVKETHGGTAYFALAQLEIFELVVDIVDPEAPSEDD